MMADGVRSYKGNKGLEYYRAYPRDFFEGVIGMPGKLRGFYRMVIDLIYMHDGMLLNDFGHISGNTGYSKIQCKRMMQELVELGKIQICSENDQFFVQKRAVSELKDSRKFQEKQAKNGASRWKNNGLSDEVAMPRGMPNECHHETTRPQDKSPADSLGENQNSDFLPVGAKQKKSPPKPSPATRLKGIKGISPEAVDSYISYRRGKKLSVSDRVCSAIINQLIEIQSNGGDPGEALTMAEMHGWQGIKASWYFNKKGQENGNGYFNSSGQSNQRANSSGPSAVEIANRGAEYAASRAPRGGTDRAAGGGFSED